MKRVLSPLISPVLVLLCVLVPPTVTNRGWWIIGRTHDGYSEPFELLGLFVSVAVLVYWYRSLRVETGDRTEIVLRRLVIGGIVLHFLYLFVNYADIAWDYRCYASAAINISKGVNPYVETSYLYPPLLAQCLAAVNAMILATPVFSYENVTSWWLVFYFYQAVQLILVFYTAKLCFSFGKRLGVPVIYVAVLVVAMFIVSAPFLRTIRFQQVNLLVLVAILYSLVRLPARPWLCGILMAVAVQVKPQGLLFPVLWLLIGHRIAVVSFVVSSLVLILGQAGFGADWSNWRQFIDSVDKVPIYNDYFRNQSLFSFVSTTTKALTLDVDREYLMLFVRACYAAIFGWFVYRFVTRERLLKEAKRKGDELLLRLCAHTVDIVLLSLVVSPLVWEHHYVLASPVVFWLFALSKGRVPKLAIVGLVLIFIPSTFDVVFLSYHKLVGTGVLIHALSPQRVFDLFMTNRDKQYVGRATVGDA